MECQSLIQREESKKMESYQIRYRYNGSETVMSASMVNFKDRESAIAAFVKNRPGAIIVEIQEIRF